MKCKFWFGSLLFFLLFSCGKDSPVQHDDFSTKETAEYINAATLKFPKKEIRAVWLATVWGLDWPQADYNVDSQKSKYTTLLDKFVELNINTVYCQVRGLGDAFYDSPYEPWSAAITGTRGKKPSYDVLKFMIDEAHQRGIGFHAWMNLYRIATRSSNSTSYPALHPSIETGWVVNHERVQIYNPAVPAVRQRLADIVEDLITKYNVDGIHFDDYFYPVTSAAGQMVSDQGDYTTFGGGYASIGDFRRDNVNKTIKAVHDVIVNTRPSVVFSVSPAPNQEYNYNNLYADVVKWCNEGWIDVVVPQLYQEIGNPYNDFHANLGFWSQNNFKASLVIGHGLYKFGDVTMPSAFHSSVELQRQFDLTRGEPKVIGNAVYSAKYLFLNNVGVVEKLRYIYKNKVLAPPLGRSATHMPTAPSNIRIADGELKWDGNALERSVIYYFASRGHEGEILSITTDKSFKVSLPGYYCVSSVDVEGRERLATVAVQKI